MLRPQKSFFLNRLKLDTDAIFNVFNFFLKRNYLLPPPFRPKCRIVVDKVDCLFH